MERNVKYLKSISVHNQNNNRINEQGDPRFPIVGPAPGCFSPKPFGLTPSSHLVLLEGVFPMSFFVKAIKGVFYSTPEVDSGVLLIRSIRLDDGEKFLSALEIAKKVDFTKKNLSPKTITPYFYFRILSNAK